MEAEKQPIERIGDIVEAYESGMYQDIDGLRSMLRELSVLNYYLTVVNIDAYIEWNAIIWNRQEESVASARVRADHKIPLASAIKEITGGG